MKKLISCLLLATFCFSIAGCSNEKVEKKDDGTYRETVILKDERKGTSGILSFSPYWEHTVNGFTNKISSVSFMKKSGSKDSKAVVLINIESINKSDKDVYNSLKRLKLETVDDKGNKITSTPLKKFETKIVNDMVAVVPIGKKHKSSFEFEFDEIEDYKSIKSVTLKYSMDFGEEDDADHERKYNEITFKLN
ncbi:TPA: hypothetical protein QC116_002984 [Bacillus thuringiensis]|nr:hypothetical protein [Bacillus thuringiensis]